MERFPTSIKGLLILILGLQASGCCMSRDAATPSTTQKSPMESGSTPSNVDASIANKVHEIQTADDGTVFHISRQDAAWTWTTSTGGEGIVHHYSANGVTSLSLVPPGGNDIGFIVELRNDGTGRWGYITYAGYKWQGACTWR